MRLRSVVALPLVATTLGCAEGNLVLPHAGPEIHLTVVSGNQQTGTVGERLPKPLIVELRDEQGDILVGRNVAFVMVSGPAGAELAPDTTVTDGDGQAVGQWMLGKMPGVYTAEARVLAMAGETFNKPLPTAEFTASAQAGRPDTLRATSKDLQYGQRNRVVSDAPVVRVADRYSNPLSGVVVHWKVTAGTGTLSASDVTTDADGLATVTWTLGNDPAGTQTLEARVDGDVNGSPVVFSAVVIF